MASTFSGLNTALTSLYAQRRGLDITGQNIANASTEGYTRQRVVMQAQNANLTPGIYASTLAVGAGVTVSTVERLRNTALDHRSYTEHANSSYLNEKAGAYALIEDVFAEPSDTALQARMQDMWDGWNAVATNPDKAAPKSALLEQATTVAATLNDASKAINNQFESIRAGLDTYVGDVNKSAEEVAKLNKEIVVAKAAGLQANELMDRRSQEILKLSQVVGATATDLPNGATNVFIGSAPLVSEFTNRPIEIEAGGATQLADLDSDVLVNLRFKDTKTAVAAGGTMGSQMELLAKDGTLHDISNRLDKVAQKLAETVNDKYGTGYSMKGDTGQQFFVDRDRPNDPTATITAGNIGVKVSDPDDLAVSTKDPKGVLTTKALDGGIADDLAELATSRDGADAEYQQLIGDLGVAAQSSIRRRDVQNAVTDQVDAARDAESGVNLDEEMTNLLTYQRGYEAASRVLTTVDSMLDQLINRTGMVGR
ncbi:flagellar hook-associated protein 1 [Actinoplanes ianthinogenes]|uniref:Flagellar hook-associated protein 1 n=1 Tax=Actinoplanes ianthinogenes TaxID=122358 RepID=A0ABN6CFH3_9ACTN|nr:flagellar hook-associated protein FlgK [Actinoplanes ianthinogenes]BCJ43099.1 flagellar hook-associated protein 1 [Actinoplanes ianthinogenes]GGQ90241.1 flagellar hook-associated protein 1 [Actinoplanes ianthinogenes]